MNIGLIREGKNPPDKRVVFSPEQCSYIMSNFNNITIYVQPSSIRCFSDSNYTKSGVLLSNDLSHCDIIMGVKEVPIDMLIDKKVFCFFSHTIKKQSYNQNLLKTILNKNIQLVDYETLVDRKGKRLIGFGRYAGIVGCYNSFLTYGMKTKTFELAYAHLLGDMVNMKKELLKIKLPNNLKIILTGSGRVANGVKEILCCLNILNVSKDEFVSKKFTQPVYVQLSTLDYNQRVDGSKSSKKDFYINPDKYTSCMGNYIDHADMLITGHFYAEHSPYILTKNHLSNTSKLKVVGDISCDIGGPIVSTIRPSTISKPIYGYNISKGVEDDYFKDDCIAVMAVDNLPCSLPKDASIDFGNVFIKQVLDDLINNGPIVSKASITLNGHLTERFRYLADYVN